MTTQTIAVTVNGVRYERSVEPRLLLSDFLRHELSLTGTHVGCEHGIYGACTVLLDGLATRSCLCLAMQTDGASVETVESALRACSCARWSSCAPTRTRTATPSWKRSAATCADAPGIRTSSQRSNAPPSSSARFRRLRNEHDRQERADPAEPPAREAGSATQVDRQEHQARRGPTPPDRARPLHRRHRPSQHAARGGAAQHAGARPH